MKTSGTPDSSPTYEEVAARLRDKYKKHTPEQREIHGDEPDEATIHGEWARQQFNSLDLSREERRARALRAMSRIYGESAQKHELADAVRS